MQCDAGEHPCYVRNSPLQAFTVQVGVCMKETLYQVWYEPEASQTEVWRAVAFTLTAKAHRPLGPK